MHLPAGADVAGTVSRLAALTGMEQVLDRDTACRRFELPKDRMGDVVAVARRDWVIGTSEARHDLSVSTCRSARTAGSASSACRSW